MNPYSKNTVLYCNYICDHAQKITEALYRITDIFPDKEPLKWYLRDEGLVIFKIFMKIKDSGIYERMKYVDEIDRAIPHMIHALELSSSGTFISRANFEVLCREYNVLLNFVKDKKEEFLPESVRKLSVTPFEKVLQEKKENGEMDIPAASPLIKDTPPKNVSHVHSPDHVRQDSAARDEKQAASPSIDMEPHTYEHEYERENKKQDPFPNANNTYYSHVNPMRKEKILDIVREKGEVSVGDISSLFQEVSEKTIQRDLVSLTQKGVLRKHGDKRWRRYALNGPA